MAGIMWMVVFRADEIIEDITRKTPRTSRPAHELIQIDSSHTTEHKKLSQKLRKIESFIGDEYETSRS